MDGPMTEQQLLHALSRDAEKVRRIAARTLRRYLRCYGDLTPRGRQQLVETVARTDRALSVMERIVDATARRMAERGACPA